MLYDVGIKHMLESNRCDHMSTQAHLGHVNSRIVIFQEKNEVPHLHTYICQFFRHPMKQCLDSQTICLDENFLFLKSSKCELLSAVINLSHDCGITPVLNGTRPVFLMGKVRIRNPTKIFSFFKIRTIFTILQHRDNHIFFYGFPLPEF